MGRASDKPEKDNNDKAINDQTSVDSDSTPEDDEDEDMMDTSENREETPDLYRNSALGM